MGTGQTVAVHIEELSSRDWRVAHNCPPLAIVGNGGRWAELPSPGSNETCAVPAPPGGCGTWGFLKRACTRLTSWATIVTPCSTTLLDARCACCRHGAVAPVEGDLP